MKKVKDLLKCRKAKETNQHNQNNIEQLSFVFNTSDKIATNLLNAIGIIRTLDYCGNPYYIRNILRVGDDYYITAASYRTNNGYIKEIDFRSFFATSVISFNNYVSNISLELRYDFGEFFDCAVLLDAKLDVSSDPRYINMGFGSELMNDVIEIAKLIHIPTIIGSLKITPDDQDHNKRMAHFYEKYGFELLPDDRIRLTIE